MTMLIELRPEVEALLTGQAAVQGVSASAYAASLLEEVAERLAASQPVPSPGTYGPPKSLRDVFEAARGLADDIEFSRNPLTGCTTPI